MTDILLKVEDLRKHYPIARGLVFQRQMGALRAVDGVTFSIGREETFGLIGQSGCGKTTVSRLILRLEPPTSGQVIFRGKDIQRLSGTNLKDYRRSVQAVFQDPYSSLSPRMRVGDIIAEPLRVRGVGETPRAKERVPECLRIVGLPPAAAELYPHEFSGGQRQRIAVARGIVLNPELLVLDEPVSALDVSIKAQILNLLYDIQQELGISYLLIAHDLAVVKHMSSIIGVMYLGKLVEVCRSDSLVRNPLHPYTKALLSAIPPDHPSARKDEIVLTGEVPSLLNLPTGCRFHPRCNSAKPICAQEEPTLTSVGDREVACHLHQ